MNILDVDIEQHGLCKRRSNYIFENEINNK